MKTVKSGKVTTHFTKKYAYWVSKKVFVAKKGSSASD